MKNIGLLIQKNKLLNPALLEVLQAVPQKVAAELIIVAEKKDLASKLQEIIKLDLDRVLICGGDGSLHVVLEEVMRLPRASRPALGVVPLGTANDFASATSYANEGLAEAVRFAAQAELRSIDIGWVNGHPFINVASGGAVAANTTDVLPSMKSLFGKFSYYLSALAKITTLETHHCRFQSLDWELEEDCIAFIVGNSTSAGGGLKVAAHAKVNDGLLDVMIIPNQDLLSLGALGAELLKDSPDLSSHRLHYRRIRDLRVESEDEIQLNVDGEPLKSKRFDFKVEPGALQVAVSEEVLR